jgi:prevent-host-death family protein
MILRERNVAVTRSAQESGHQRGTPTSLPRQFLLQSSNDTKVALMRTELVTTLKRKATEIIAGLELDQDPVLITQHGKPAAYLMAVEAFESLQRRIGILEGIARGERAIEEGRVVTHAEAKKRMARWLS